VADEEPVGVLEEVLGRAIRHPRRVGRGALFSTREGVSTLSLSLARVLALARARALSLARALSPVRDAKLERDGTPLERDQRERIERPACTDQVSPVQSLTN
jgi:hypothetical protein